jgi:hypothetical protein
MEVVTTPSDMVPVWVVRPNDDGGIESVIYQGRDAENEARAYAARFPLSECWPLTLRPGMADRQAFWTKRTRSCMFQPELLSEER